MDRWMDGWMDRDKHRQINTYLDRKIDRERGRGWVEDGANFAEFERQCHLSNTWPTPNSKAYY